MMKNLKKNKKKKKKKKKKNQLSEEELLYNRSEEIPLGKHVDTGVLTFILTSDVGGLQILDRKTNEYYHPEKSFKPGTHMIVIVGRKMELFSYKKKIDPTWHQVKIPVDLERLSLLYFMEIQKEG